MSNWGVSVVSVPQLKNSDSYRAVVFKKYSESLYKRDF